MILRHDLDITSDVSRTKPAAARIALVGMAILVHAESAAPWAFQAVPGPIQRHSARLRLHVA